jgi:hypothetical protein
MELENPSSPAEAPLAAPEAESTFAPEAFALPAPKPESRARHMLRWVFRGDARLRSGWSVALFIALFVLFVFAAGTAVSWFVHQVLHTKLGDFSASSTAVGETLQVLAMLAAAAIVARIEGSSILAYNLAGPRRGVHFLSGLVIGFASLSALVGALAMGGWLHFGPLALSGAQIFGYAALWGFGFLMVGCLEEGTMRCFLLATLTRGINFWWALGIIGAICLDLLIRSKGNGVWGVYAIALMGLPPCLWLYLKRSPGSGFWQAAWVTSTFFGYIHTGNNGENWIGIFAAAAIGFVFCVSVRVTGSAWWAIGCHAAWDWAETYFYGTADSGFVAKGHYLTTTIAGPTLWSGGTDGPEGSILVLGVILLMLLVLLALYGRRRVAVLPAPALEQALG